MIDRAIRLILPLAALAAGVWLLAVVTPALRAAGGMPFDLRMLGYGLNDALAYVAQLSPDGMAIYLGPYRIADTLFPLALMPTLLLPLRGRGQFWFLPALAYGMADLFENISVAKILRAGAEMQASDVMLASTLTQGKFLALSIAVLLAAWSLWQSWRDR
jgi:hypothetical protein